MRSILLFRLLLVLILANFLGIQMVLVSGQCQSGQQLLLLQMKNSLVFDSASAVRLMQWSESTDCCAWSGIDCDVAGLVIGLDLSNESITGEIENVTGLFDLQYLKSLNMAFNRFKAAQIPSRLANLTNLIYLNLSNAGFAGQIPIEISYMARLVTLDFSSLTFEGSLLLKLENPNLRLLVQNLTELRELYLDGVNISATGKEWCRALSSSLPNLSVLSLSKCFLSGPIDSSLANLRSLSVFHMDSNDLSSPVPEFFADFPYLTSLHLSDCGLYGVVPKKLFQIPTLETLELSYNEFLQGFLPNFPHNLSLQSLVLHDTNFSGTILESIGNLKNLSILDLAFCNFNGSLPTLMANLYQLVYLDLSRNEFTGPLPSFHMSEKLSYLHLSHNFLTGKILFTDRGKLFNLVYVGLSYNSLDGRIPPSLFTLPSLESLQLDNNRFEGQIPEFSVASSSLLNTLDLSANRLEGPIPVSIFELKNLKVLVLSSNKLNSTVQLDMLQKLGNLCWLDLSNNNLAVQASRSNSYFLPKISTLRLASCKLRLFPALKNQSQLYHLDLSNNQISGKIPNWIWESSNGTLVHLNLSNNLLIGLQEPYSVSYLDVLDLRSNLLQGKIPKLPPVVLYVDFSNNSFTSIPADIGNSLFFTVFFSLSDNGLTGIIPESICNATNLQVLDLSGNNFSGRIPPCLIESSYGLGVLNLRRNSLHGTISDKFSENCTLQTVDLSDNQLEGMVPKSLANCAKLEILNIGNNHFNDTFPCWINSVSSLRILVLRSNKFHGEIDCPEMKGSWPMLQIFDLASNRFSGRLPKKYLTTWEAMMVDSVKSELKHLQFEFLEISKLYYQDQVTVTSKGLRMELLKILTVFTSIDLSCNNFQGAVPAEIGLLKSLHILNLSYNAFTGPLPLSVENMQQLESLDLSVNNLTGVIPAQLASLNFLSFLNVSYNHFVGRIPLGTQLQSFSSTSFEGNEGLCGPPLTIDCPNSSILPPPPPASPPESKINWLFIMMSIGFTAGFGAVVAPLMFSKNVNKWYDDCISKYKVKFGM